MPNVNPGSRAVVREPSKSSAAKTPGAQITGTQLAMAFDGDIPPARTTLGYRLATLLVFFVMVLLPVVYVAIIAAAAAGVCWYAAHATVMFDGIRSPRALLFLGVAYAGPLIAGCLLVVFMTLPLFWRSKKQERPLWVDRREQRLLYAYVDKLCDVMRVPRPVRIDVVAAPTASAHIDNGLLGLVSRKLVLTVGLPLAQAMSLREFTGVIAHELGHFSQGWSMRLGYAVHRINGWFVRLAYTRSGVDDAIDSAIGNAPHWTITFVGGMTKLMLGLARLILKGMAILSHALSMHLSRQAEYDADRQSARIVGGDAIGNALQALPFLATAGTLALAGAQAGWAKRVLPDDLVTITDAYQVQMPTDIKDKLTARILAEDARWFDTHPPLFKRVAELKKGAAKGVLKLNAPATILFREFDELSKLTTINLYMAALGPQLEPEHLVPTNVATMVKQPRIAGPRATA